jgi:L-ascorbate metabolism protein UlaG (beta-lactamase superfamily)
MIIRYLGHAAFLIIAPNGTRIITDPYNAEKCGDSFRFEKIVESADIVTISHEHNDHNFDRLSGDPVYIRGGGNKEVKGIKITGIDVFHDDQQGRQRGPNTIFNLDVEGLNIVHLGDLGHILTTEDVKRIGPVDILLIPVGGYFTIGPKVAQDVIDALKPRIVIPMHYQNEKCTFPIAPVDDFIKDKDFQRFPGEIEITKDRLPRTTTIYVLPPTK